MLNFGDHTLMKNIGIFTLQQSWKKTKLFFFWKKFFVKCIEPSPVVFAKNNVISVK
jgi:ribosome biogenesis protein Tsr3